MVSRKYFYFKLIIFNNNKVYVFIIIYVHITYFTIRNLNLITLNNVRITIKYSILMYSTIS